MKIRKLLENLKASETRQAFGVLLSVGLAFASQDVMAAGGLDKATNTAQEIQSWMYIITGVACTANISYLCVMAKLGKKQWNDVIMSIGQTALAGGAISIATWSYGLFA
ncbi:TrbC/VirB2 family protein [Vibrio vulnificus]|uniref:TrbC/VirB2 family protein n=1 Tax=Vibrio vulnificus TaxID=672 RepID=UPI004058687A